VLIIFEDNLPGEVIYACSNIAPKKKFLLATTTRARALSWKPDWLIVELTGMRVVMRPARQKRK
jgi:hypothetical protein